MRCNLIKKLSACALCAAIACTAVPGTAFAADTGAKANSSAVFSTDFEDGNSSMFSKRGDSDTSVIKVIEDSNAPSGKKVMSITGRNQSWNGPSLSVKGILEPDVKYDISVKVKAAWYNTVCISLQHTPAAPTNPSTPTL